MEVGSLQLELISKAKKYLQNNLSKNVNVHSSGICYFCSFGLFTPGYAKLKLWNEGLRSILSIFKIYYKDVLSISSLYNYCVVNKPKINNKYNKIIVSWAKKNDFLSNGTYFDKYFKINSNDLSNSLWFLIYEGKSLPENIDNNILIFTKSTKGLKYNFFYLTNYIIKSIICSKFSPKKFLHKISWFTAFSSISGNNIKKFINNDVKTIIMPYEGQPFQNTIFKTSKEINKNIRTIGCVTSFPVGLPTNYIFRDGSPEELIVNGKDQYYCFKKNLNWKDNQLKVLPSTRFTKNSADMSGYIYLPIAINSTDIIIKYLKIFLDKNREKSISKLIVRNHPSAKNSKKHLKLIKKIKDLLSERENSFLKKNKISKMSIFIGATASIIEALERGVEVIHICDDPVLQSYSSDLWPSIKVSEINENTFEYTLLKKGNLIKFGDGDKIFEKFYVN
jgi:hypothetical protein|tara:strand:- start:2807 stop:4153 length:1347 start_codon:yes stop_codon:yes gene_type:complete